MEIERRVRWYQRPFHEYLVNGGKRAIEIAHRRWGKDEITLGATCELAHKRIGSYWHCLPEYEQARKALWTAINPHTGKRRIDEAFPPELRESKDEQQMFIKLKCGSTWQLVGSDRYNSLVGAGICGVVFSEWALANPSAWGYIRPMIEENDGWAAFITTPRGRNHAKAMYDMAKADMESGGRWFAEISSVHETGSLSPAQIAESLKEYIALYGEDVGTAQFQQEYECSFNAAILGAFYAKEMLAVRNSGRILEFEPDDAYPIHTAWDIGVRDDTSIWWFQVVGGRPIILDCYTASGAGVDHFAEVIEKRGYSRKGSFDYVPHDAKVKEWGSSRTRIESMMSLGLNPRLVPSASKADGINAARITLKTAVFHSRCETGISALEQYRREWDDERKVFRANEVHDWCFVGETEVVTRYGTCQIKSLPNQGEVLTPCGWKPYLNPRVTRANAPLVEVVFADGLTVRCTPDHMFMTEGGWISAERLVKGSLIQSCLTPSRSISMALSTACILATDTLRKAAHAFIEMFGRMPSVKFRSGVISTTETMTHPTTSFGTWNACRPTTIFKKRWQAGAAGVGKQGSTKRLVQEPLTGIGQKRVSFGTSATLSEHKVGQSGSEKTSLAFIVRQFLKRLFGKAGRLKSFVPKTAKWRTIASVRELNFKEDVWCITVPGVEAFALSNGAVVHNCSHLSDAFRYLSLSWREVAPKPAVPIGGVDPLGRATPMSKPLPKPLQEMSYDEMHRAMPKRGRERL
ncbi:MAG: hypothetical protein RL328_155 [Acidobacteriota bacterium]